MHVFCRARVCVCLCACVCVVCYNHIHNTYYYQSCHHNIWFKVAYKNKQTKRFYNTLFKKSCQLDIFEYDISILCLW